jgi:hypothetical protein
VQSGAYTGWTFLRDSTYAGGNGGRDHIRDILLTGGGGYQCIGLIDIASPRLTVENVTMWPNEYGIYLYGNDYESYIRNVNIEGSNMLFGLGSVGSASIETFDHVFIDGPVYPLAVSTSMLCIRCIVQMEAVTAVPITLQLVGNSKYTFLDTEIEGENSGANFVNSVYLAGESTSGVQDSVQFIGGTIEFKNGSPFFDRYAKLSVDGTIFHNLGSGTPYLITSDIKHVPAGSIRFVDLNSDTATPIIDNPSLAQGSQQGVLYTAAAEIATTGTSGIALCGQTLQGLLKIAHCYLKAYAQTGSPQTYTFPVAFSTVPVLLESGGSCGTYRPATSAGVLTLPAGDAMTAETCNVVLIGQ